MPLYIVRWPNLSASLVKARNEDDLVDMLDEVDDPGGCKWKRYNGPVWVDFELPVELNMEARPVNRPLSLEEVELNIDELVPNPEEFRLSPAPSDTSAEMLSKVREFAFPTLEKLIAEKIENIPPDEIKSAVLEDLKPLIEYRWRVAQLNRRTDPEAEILKRMRVTRRLPYMDGLEE